MAHFTDLTSLVFTLHCTVGHTLTPRNIPHLINVWPKEDATSARGFKQPFGKSALRFWGVLELRFIRTIKLHTAKTLPQGANNSQFQTCGRRACFWAAASCFLPRRRWRTRAVWRKRLGPLSLHCPKEMNIYERCDLNRRGKINSRCRRRLLLKDLPMLESALGLSPHATSTARLKH